MLFWDFFTRVMQGVTMAFFEDVWSRNFINVFATPLLISEYLTGLVLTGIATSLVGLIVMLVLATWLFGLPFFSLGVLLLPFLLVLFLFGIALGVLASAMVLRLGPASEWLVWPIPALLSPFVGVFYPLSTLPAWMRAVGHLLPPSYVFENMRSVVGGHGYSGDGAADRHRPGAAGYPAGGMVVHLDLPLRGTQRITGALHRRERQLGKAAP